MSGRSRWLLPDGVDELLPPEAERLEALRRRALDTLRGWGYRLCVPPSIEFLDSLLSGIGEDLELQTFKLTDQVSGRLLGIPADMTPQVARIDAHRLPTDCPQRLCYLGPTLRTRPDKFAGSRNPLQIGAELYGHAGIESDAEVICLMAEVLERLELAAVTLEIGHMGVFKELAAAAGLAPAAEATLLEALLRKAGGEVRECLEAARVAPGLAALLGSLLRLNGGPEVAAAAAEACADAPPAVREATASLVALVARVRRRRPDLALHIDLAELRGYKYHTGVMFAAYTPRHGRAIAWGGRYDNIGREFGRPRPATGFSADLKALAALAPPPAADEPRIYAPPGDEPALQAAIHRARRSGQVVVQGLPGQTGGARELGCTQALRAAGGEWIIEDA